MKRFFILAALAVGAPLAVAQVQYQSPQPDRKIETTPKADAPKAQPAAAPAASVDIPKHKCEDPGPYPGRVGMQTEDRRARFIKGVENYRNCMVAFVEQRKATVEANQTAAKAAIDELNARIKKINDEQAAAQN